MDARDTGQHSIENLPDGARHVDEETILFNATVDGTPAMVRCSVEEVVDINTVSSLMGVTKGDELSFRCEQGRGGGTVTEVQEGDGGRSRTIRVAADGPSEDTFEVTVSEDRRPSATHFEYIPEDNAYEEWPLGGVTRISVDR